MMLHYEKWKKKRYEFYFDNDRQNDRENDQIMTWSEILFQPKYRSWSDQRSHLPKWSWSDRRSRKMWSCQSLIVFCNFDFKYFNFTNFSVMKDELSLAGETEDVLAVKAEIMKLFKDIVSIHVLYFCKYNPRVVFVVRVGCVFLQI